MGKHRSDDSDGDYSRRSKKKKKRRSRSSSDSESSRSRKSRRKHRKSSQSRSRSSLKRRTHASRSSRRSRSSSTDGHSNSRKHRSVSRTSDRRGSRRSKSHSRSPSRKHNSHRHRSRSLSHSLRRGSRSHSKDSRSFSGERSNSQRHHTSSSDNKLAGGGGGGAAAGGGGGEISEMTPSEKAEERMRQAFKAAAAAGEKLKGHAVPSFTNSSLLESHNFAASVAAIDSNEFVASSFKSSRSNKIKDEPADGGYNHDDAIFGSLAISGFTLTPDPDNKPIQFDGDSIVHPSLFCDQQEKMEKWIIRLTQLRKRGLEGDGL